MFHVPNKFRVKEGPFQSTNTDGNNGMFMFKIFNIGFTAIASDGMGWEHVSVSSVKVPKWSEMCVVKNMFWDEEDCVIQFHPPASEYVNNCGTCLHLWRPVGIVIPRPPKILVGI